MPLHGTVLCTAPSVAALCMTTAVRRVAVLYHYSKALMDDSVRPTIAVTRYD